VELHVDLETLVVRLVDPLQLRDLWVVVDGPPGATVHSHGHRLGDVVAHRHVGVLEPDGTVAVDRGILEFLSAGEVDDGWDEELDAALDRAAQDGRLDGSGRLQASVRWPGG